MNLSEIFQAVSAGDLVLIALLILSIVQITPIKLNPWTFLAKHLGRAINGEVMQKVESMQKDLIKMHGDIDKIQLDCEKKQADDARNRILLFDDELRVHKKHSRELFDQILIDVDFYENFCNTHKDTYKNSKATSAINNIRHVYDVVKEANDFI